MVSVQLLTIGHGAVDADEFVRRCVIASIARIVDIRTAPGSRRHPHFGRAAMERWLPAAGVAYEWEPRLGGFRKPARDSPNTAWRNDAFRGYADYTRTDDFKSALSALLERASRQRVSVMCAETLWWRCHRRIVSDVAVLLHRVEVLHVIGDELRPHRLTAAARRAGADVIYAAAAQTLPLS